MANNCAADSFHKKKLCSRLSSSEVRNGLSYGIKVWTDLSSVLSKFNSRLWQTDRQTEFSSLYRLKQVHFQPVLPTKHYCLRA